MYTYYSTPAYFENTFFLTGRDMNTVYCYIHSAVTQIHKLPRSPHPDSRYQVRMDSVCVCVCVCMCVCVRQYRAHVNSLVNISKLSLSDAASQLDTVPLNLIVPGCGHTHTLPELHTRTLHLTFTHPSRRQECVTLPPKTLTFAIQWLHCIGWYNSTDI